MQLAKVLVVVLLGLGLSSCATLFGSSSDEIQLNSEPEGAVVRLNGNKLGVTPFKVTLPRTHEATYLTFSKEGYRSQTLFLPTTVDGAAYFNIGFISTTFGASSWGTDFLSGKMFKYSPGSYIVELDALKTSAVGPLTPVERKPLAFVIANYQKLESEVSRGSGETIDGLCWEFDLDAEACRRFGSRLQAEQASLLSQPHSLAWYRRANELRQQARE